MASDKSGPAKVSLVEIYDALGVIEKYVIEGSDADVRASRDVEMRLMLSSTLKRALARMEGNVDPVVEMPLPVNWSPELNQSVQVIVNEVNPLPRTWKYGYLQDIFAEIIRRIKDK
ncbi:hypothetical protein KW785_01760 [Candidatus Parcubacteria bacterium]|nr:hypothetical protein [Candidatus Parcubacteria bacterium]